MCFCCDFLKLFSTGHYFMLFLKYFNAGRKMFQYFMLGWPCSLNYINNNQLDALFIFSLLSYHTSTCFGRISSPSSGGRMYICGKGYLLYCTVDCHRAWTGVSAAHPDCVRIFHWHNPSDRTMALGSTKPLNRNEYQEYFLGVKAAGV
jgi:hypothetical protein